jgi:hypothetical protein
LSGESQVCIPLTSWHERIIIHDFRPGNDHAVSISLYGFLMLSQGLGNVLCTPIATSLADISTDSPVPTGTKSGFGIDDGRFFKLILYIGMCYAGAALTVSIGWIIEIVIVRRQRKS